MIILLDLNYTLAANSDTRMAAPDYGAFVDGGEHYRQWLVELVRPHHVILITARPARWRDRTLARIMAVTGWTPNEAHFNERMDATPPKLKREILQQQVYPTHGRDVTYLALESNTATRAMYRRERIPAIAVPRDGAAWPSLPTEAELRASLL